jgi:ABC-type nitrate/sulfonate/bicarbonate transport system ATPase subunit
MFPCYPASLAAMDVLDHARAKIRGRGLRVVFPEAEDERIVAAARRLRDEQLALPILLKKVDAARIDRYAALYGQGRPEASPKVARRIAAKALFHAGLMVKAGDADALVAGAGWNQTQDDWRVFLKEGRVLAFRDGGHVIATAATLPYGGRFGWETEEDINSAKQALSDCDLLEYSDRLMNELSGGERQRVVLARALAGQTSVLLLDEPTANLDLAHQALMFKLVRERCRTYRASAIVITHDLNLAAEFADRVLMLDGGRLFALGSAGEVLTAENIKKVFGVRALLDKNPVSRNVRVTTLY